MEICNNRFYVGTTRGTLLCTGDKPNDFNVWKSDDSSEVTAMSEGRRPEEILLGYRNGTGGIFNTDEGRFTRKFHDLEGDEGITGVGYRGNKIIFAKQDGLINIWKGQDNDYFSINLDEKGSLDCMVCQPNRENVIGTGGEYNDFKMWDVNTKQCIFKSKSLGHDELQLPIPTSVRDIAFFPNEVNLGACCTQEGHVLLYDDRAQRKPIAKFLEKKASYTTISVAYRDRQVLVGTTKGYMQWIDLKTIKLLKTYTTFTGSVTSIVCDPVEPYVASVSLDRHLRIHNLNTKELIYKCYMKQSLTKLVVKPVIKDESVEGSVENKAGQEIVDEEYEDLFKNMEEVCSNMKIKKKKRKSLIVEANIKKRK